MLDEGLDHELGHLVLNHSLATVIIYRKSAESESSGLTNREFIILKQILKVGECVIEKLTANRGECECTQKKSCLLSNFAVDVLEQTSSNLQDLRLDHHVRSFLQHININIRNMVATFGITDFSTYLMMDKFVKSLECISDFMALQLVNEKNFLELGDHPVKHGDCDLESALSLVRVALRDAL